MGILSRRKGEATPRSVQAAAVPLAGPNAVAVSRALKPGNEDWQKEAWYHYDACGEFRSAVTWIANAVSKADIYAAETDPETGTIAGPTEDARAMAAAATVLGGFTKRGQILKTLAVQWQVPGESFIIVRPRDTVRGVPQPDEWLAISGTKVTFKGGGWQYQDPFTLMQVTLRPGTDRLIRVWSPHPNDGAKADSAARPALPILREIEKASQHIAGRLDSRLGMNGVYWIPQELDFPRAEGQKLGEAFSEYLLATMEASLSNPGTAAAHVPVVAVVPGEQIAAARHDDLATAFDAAVGELRTTALARLAATLDMPNETAEGSTGGMNHWGAWQVEETTYKIFIEPLLDMIGDAITHEWFWDVLRAMGESNPERFVLAWETSGIVSRPDRTAELQQLWDANLISNDYLLSEMGIPDEAIPSEEEHRVRLIEQLLKISPALLSEGLGSELGIEVSAPEPPAVEAEAGGTPALTSATPSEPDQRPDDDVPEGLVAAAEFAVYDALSRAGKRLLTREHRGQFGHVKAEELYLSIPYVWGQVPKLMEGSFAFIDGVADAYGLDREALQARLTYHLESILKTKLPYSRDSLRRVLR